MTPLTFALRLSRPFLFTSVLAGTWCCAPRADKNESSVLPPPSTSSAVASGALSAQPTLTAPQPTLSQSVAMTPSSVPQASTVATASAQPTDLPPATSASDAPGDAPSVEPTSPPLVPSTIPTTSTDAGDAPSATASVAGTVFLPSTVFIAGDSTVSNYADTASSSDQAGWGQMLHEYFDDRVTIDNRAIGGRTARRFIDEGHLDTIDADIAAGDTLLVQFGTNDGNKTATYTLNGEAIPYYLDPGTDFKRYLNQYIDVALAHEATLVLVTPPPRNSAYCTGGNGTGAHAEAMRELAVERSVALSDLNQKSVAYLTAICPAPAVEDFFLRRADGTVDGTHFQENGARILASLVVEGIVESGVPLASAVK